MEHPSFHKPPSAPLARILLRPLRCPAPAREAPAGVAVDLLLQDGCRNGTSIQAGECQGEHQVAARWAVRAKLVRILEVSSDNKTGLVPAFLPWLTFERVTPSRGDDLHIVVRQITGFDHSLLRASKIPFWRSVVFLWNTSSLARALADFLVTVRLARKLKRRLGPGGKPAPSPRCPSRRGGERDRSPVLVETRAGRIACPSRRSTERWSAF